MPPGPSSQVALPTGGKCPPASALARQKAMNKRWLIDFQGGVAGWDYRAGFGNSKNETTDSVTGGYTRDDIIQDGAV